MNTVQTHPSNIFQWKNIWKLVKKRAITFFTVEDVWDYSRTVFNQGLSPALGLSLSSDALGEEFVVRCRHSLAFSRAYTDFLLSNTCRPCSGISFINLTALVGDLESVWPHKDAALSLRSTTITVSGQLHRYGQANGPTLAEINRYRGWMSSRNGW